MIIEFEDGSSLSDELAQLMMDLATRATMGTLHEVQKWAQENAPACTEQTVPEVRYDAWGGHPAEYCGNQATTIVDGEPRCDQHKEGV